MVRTVSARRWGVVAVTAVVAGVVSAGAVAMATTHDNQTFFACERDGIVLVDSLRVNRTPRCPKKYSVVQWNEAGAQGPVGAVGETGAQGPGGAVGEQGPAGSAGLSALRTVAVSGGPFHYASSDSDPTDIWGSVYEAQLTVDDQGARLLVEFTGGASCGQLSRPEHRSQLRLVVDGVVVALVELSPYIDVSTGSVRQTIGSVVLRGVSGQLDVGAHTVAAEVFVPGGVCHLLNWVLSAEPI